MRKEKKSNLNDSIKLYVSFSEKLIKNPNDELIQDSKRKFDIIYNIMKSDKTFRSDLKQLSKIIINEQEKDIIFRYGENEEILALMHTMIEEVEDKELIMTDNGFSPNNLIIIQDGLSKLWKATSESSKEKITVSSCLIDQELRIITN